MPAGSSTTEEGTVIVTLTDAEGGFASYTVDVLSISLERGDGSAIEILPQSARVDFAQLTTLSEVVAAANVAPGEFVGGSIRIDYADAEIFVETGGEIVAAEVYDSQGNLLEICVGTGKENSLEYYMKRPRHAGDFHGQAPVLWLIVEMLNGPAFNVP